MEALLGSEDHGKDLPSVLNLLKKHQLVEADISAHEVHLPVAEENLVSVLPPLHCYVSSSSSMPASIIVL